MTRARTGAQRTLRLRKGRGGKARMNTEGTEVSQRFTEEGGYDARIGWMGVGEAGWDRTWISLGGGVAPPVNCLVISLWNE
jgi:hypothetical protein